MQLVGALQVLPPLQAELLGDIPPAWDGDLYNEWQYVLKMDKAGLTEYILSRLETNP